MILSLLVAQALFTADASRGQVLLQSVARGFAHIVPEGLDHIAFVLGLFFLAKHLPELVRQVAAFTVAHSAAMGLSMVGWLAVPSVWVEIAVALSITFVAVEGLWGGRWQAWRLPMVAVFGMVHGLAYAHSFQELLVDSSVMSLALAGFTMGIGLGQFTVVGAAVLLTAPVWPRAWYRPRVAVPATCVIGLCGLAWAVERALAL